MMSKDPEIGFEYPGLHKTSSLYKNLESFHYTVYTTYNVL